MKKIEINNLYLKLLSAIIAILVTTLTLFSQTQELRIEGIENGEIDVSVSPLFNIVTNFKIDTTHFRMNPEDIVKDSLSIPPDSVYYFDSVVSVYTYAPNVLLISEHTYLNEDPSDWHLFTEFGLFEVINDTTITFNGYALQNYTKYYIVARDVWVIDNNDTLTCDTTSIYFTTQKPLIYMLNTNIEKTIKCSDILFVEFSEKLDSASTPFGEILQFYKIDSVNYLSNNEKEEVLSEIFPDLTLSQDSTKLLIDNLVDVDYNDKYYGKINMEYLTGDSLSNLYFEFWVNRRVKIKMTSTGTSTKIPPFLLDSLTLTIGDTLNLAPYEYINGKHFASWSCDEDSTLNSTARSFQLITDCSTLEEITLIAIYEDIPKDTIVVVNYNSSGVIKVYDKDRSYLGGTGTYIIDRIPRRQLSVLFEPADSSQFDDWSSTIQSYDGDEFPYIEIIGGQGSYGQISPNIKARADTYILNIKVAFSNNGYESRYDYGTNIEDFVDISPSMDTYDPNGIWMSKIITSSDPNFEQQISVDIIHDQYYTYKIYSVEGDVSSTFRDGYSVGGPYRETWGDIINFSGPKKTKNLFILIDRKLVEYEVELVAENSGLIPNSREKAGLNVWDCYPPSSSDELLYGRLEATSRDDYKEYFRYSVKAPQTVWIDAYTNIAELEFSHYNDEAGYYAGATPTNHYMAISNITQDYTTISGQKIQAMLDEPFAITSISSNIQDYYYDYDSYTVNDIFNDNIAIFNHIPDYRDLDYNFKNVERLRIDPTANSIILTINFNAPVNTNTVNDLKNIWIEDYSDRIDFPSNSAESKKFYYYPESTLGNFVWSNNNQTLTLIAKMQYDTRTYYNLPKFELFKLLFTNNIKDSQGRGLSCYKGKNKTELYAFSEFPHIKVYVDEIEKVGLNTDPDDNIFWSEYYGIFLGYTYELVNNDWKLTLANKFYPQTYTYTVLGGLFDDIASNDFFLMDVPVTTFSKTSLDFGMVFFEHDRSSLSNLFPDLWDDLIEFCKDTGPNVNKIMDFCKPYREVTVLFYTYLSDDWAGSNNRIRPYGSLFDGLERWGTWNSYNNQVSFNSNYHAKSNPELNLKFKVIVE